MQTPLEDQERHLLAKSLTGKSLIGKEDKGNKRKKRRLKLAKGRSRLLKKKNRAIVDGKLKNDRNRTLMACNVEIATRI